MVLSVEISRLLAGIYYSKGFVAQIRNKLKMLMFKTINPNSDAVRTVWII
jgi:hypothetical protein